MLHRPTGQRVPSRRFYWQRLLSRAILCSFVVIPSGFAATQPDRMAEYKEKYDRETDPIRKAKALGNYGDAQVAEFVREATAYDADAAFATISAYRDEVRSAFDALKATNNDPERKPDGFKELQIHLRKSLWEMDRSLPLVPYDRRADFQNVRDELGRIHANLIQMLFPRMPGGKKSGEVGKE